VEVAAALERPLQINATQLRPARDEASLIRAEALVADRADLFVSEAESNRLVALGESAPFFSQRPRLL
jgi:hypothetical protein